MPSSARQAKRIAKRPRTLMGLEHWKLEDAKARLSEVVRLAKIKGPQLVTVRGKEAAIIIAPDEYERLLPERKSLQPLGQFLQGLGLGRLQVKRDPDTGREIAL